MYCDKTAVFLHPTSKFTVKKQLHVYQLLIVIFFFSKCLSDLSTYREKKTTDLKTIFLRSFTLTANLDNSYRNEGPSVVLVCFVQNELENCMLTIYFSTRCISMCNQMVTSEIRK